MELIISGEIQVSSLQIAAWSGRDHKDVMNGIKKMLAQLTSKDSGILLSSYVDCQNRKQSMFLLQQREALIFIGGFGYKIRESIVDKILSANTEEYTKKKSFTYFEEEKDDSYIYLIHSHDDVYKIGVSQRPKERLQSLGTLSPYDLTLVMAMKHDDAYGAEISLHEKFKEKRMNGEWFKLTDKDVSYIVNSFRQSKLGKLMQKRHELSKMRNNLFRDDIEEEMKLIQFNINELINSDD